MEICNIFKEGKVHKIYLSKQMAEQMTGATGIGHSEGEELILCELDERFECPYREIQLFVILIVKKILVAKRMNFIYVKQKG